ncbi:MAG TPA: urease accessory protein UreE [Acetobacteraceae bacterium]|nr:urease accessory protein UreE [Acetobacteraceae bacterium]
MTAENQMRAHGVKPANTWNPDSATDSILLDHDHRHRRRIALTTERGRPLLLDLPHAAHLRDGDGLLTDTGETIRVRAAPEPLLEIHAHDPATLVRIAWHLGNRHLPVQVAGAALRIRADYVIADLVRKLGAHAHAIEAPFDPEAGAYAGGSHHHHPDDDDHHH